MVSKSSLMKLFVRRASGGNAPGRVGPAALAGAVLALAASAGAAMAEDSRISIYFVGCAAPTGFHGYLARGAAEAGKNLGVNVTYIYPDELTIPNQVAEDRRSDRCPGERHRALRLRRGCGLRRRRQAGQGRRHRLRQRRRARPLAIAGPRPERHLPVPDRLGRKGRRRADRQAAGSRWASRAASSSATSSRATRPAATAPTSEIDALKAAGIEAEFLETSMDPGQQSEARRQLPARQSRHRGGDQRLRRQRRPACGEGGQRPNDLILTGYDLDAQSLDGDPGRTAGLHHRPAAVLARLHAGPAADPLPQVRADRSQLLPDRPDDRRQVEHRAGREARDGRLPLSGGRSSEGAGPAAQSRARQTGARPGVRILRLIGLTGPVRAPQIRATRGSRRRLRRGGAAASAAAGGDVARRARHPVSHLHRSQPGPVPDQADLHQRDVGRRGTRHRQHRRDASDDRRTLRPLGRRGPRA